MWGESLILSTPSPLYLYLYDSIPRPRPGCLARGARISSRFQYSDAWLPGAQILKHVSLSAPTLETLNCVS